MGRKERQRTYQEKPVTMSTKRKIKVQAQRIAALESEVAELTSENERLMKLLNGPRGGTLAKAVTPAPVIQFLGSLLSESSSPREDKPVLSFVSVAAGAAQTPKAAPAPPLTRAESAPTLMVTAPVSPRRKLSVFTDENVKNYDKFTAGTVLGVETSRPTYKVEGVTIKAPVSNQREKWQSVEVSKPSQPRRLSRCWRRGPAANGASTASSPRKIVQRRRSRSAGALPIFKLRD